MRRQAGQEWDALQAGVAKALDSLLEDRAIPSDLETVLIKVQGVNSDTTFSYVVVQQGKVA